MSDQRHPLRGRGRPGPHHPDAARQPQRHHVDDAARAGSSAVGGRRRHVRPLRDPPRRRARRSARATTSPRSVARRTGGSPDREEPRRRHLAHRAEQPTGAHGLGDPQAGHRPGARQLSGGRHRPRAGVRHGDRCGRRADRIPRGPVDGCAAEQSVDVPVRTAVGEATPVDRRQHHGRRRREDRSRDEGRAGRPARGRGRGARRPPQPDRPGSARGQQAHHQPRARVDGSPDPAAPRRRERRPRPSVRCGPGSTDDPFATTASARRCAAATSPSATATPASGSPRDASTGPHRRDRRRGERRERRSLGGHASPPRRPSGDRDGRLRATASPTPNSTIARPGWRGCSTPPACSPATTWR